MSPLEILLAVLLTLISACWAVEDSALSITSRLKGRRLALSPQLVTRPQDVQYDTPATARQGRVPLADLELLDTLLLASVDGMFHAVNRTTGQRIWSMDAARNEGEISPLHNLVRTDHALGHPDRQLSELFIVEPQSGDIFVLPEAADLHEPLRKLPYSVPQLVESSPFTLPDPPRVFVGKKETSIITIDFKTGKILRTAGTEILWTAEASEESSGSSSLIQIGRTDYTINVMSNNERLQTLSFTAYGPNNLNREQQLSWTHTPDGLYIESSWNGGVYAVETTGEAVLWKLGTEEPIVAVFDVVREYGSLEPLVLLQPRPRLHKLAKLEQKTVIRRIANSLYALGDSNFPLVRFAEVPSLRTLEGSEKYPSSKCGGLSCYTGPRFSEDDGGASTRSMRLLPQSDDVISEARGSPLLIQKRDQRDQTKLGGGQHTTTGEVPPAGPTPTRPNIINAASLNGPQQQPQQTNWSLILPFAGGFIAVWLLLRKFMKIESHSSPRAELSRPSQPETHSPLMSPRPSHSRQPSEQQHMSQTHSNPPSSSGITAVSVPSTSRGILDRIPPPSASLPPPPPFTASKARDDVEESEKEEKDVEPGKKKTRRRKRGKKNKGPVTDDPDAAGEEIADDYINIEPSPLPSQEKPVVVASQSLPLPVQSSPPSLVVDTSKVLGRGSHGTVVYEGALQGRPVAVKRLLHDFVTVASREVALLQESDDHPNVIRYFYQEQKDDFLYIALELCPASLADIVEQPNQFKEISASVDRKRALMQVTSGLRHLHSLKIIHRDIKPQNILVSKLKHGQHRMMISDFGLCKKLEMDQTSFLPTMVGQIAAGTVGWRAPEILRGEVKLDEVAMEGNGGSNPSLGGGSGSGSNGASSSSTRLTKSVDIFALGCLYYYTLTNGDHPFGDRFSREACIIKGDMSLDGLETWGEEGHEAMDLITRMLDPEPKDRPDTVACLIHPFFWTPARRLAFLQDASDRFEIMERDPPEVGLLALESSALEVVGKDWYRQLDRVFIDNLGKYRKYDSSSVRDLLRVLRNKKHHYQDLPENVKRHLGPLPEGFLSYFTKRFPALFLHVHSVINSLPIRYDSMFRTYFELDHD